MEKFGVSDLLAAMVRLEQTGNRFYTALSERATDEEEKKFFAHLAGEELRHEEIYAGLAEQYKSAEPQNIMNEPYGDYLDILLNQSFDFSEAELEDRMSAWRIAVGLEKDTLLFINEVQPLIDTKEQHLFDRIRNEERGHLRALVDYRDKHKF